MKHTLIFALLCVCCLQASRSMADTLSESFGSDPLLHGWQTYGNSNLFHWNSTNQNLEVTWDNTQPNSYFFKPLGTTLSKADAFSLAFDLQLTSVGADSPQIAIGLFNYSNATNSTFSRPAGTTPNLFEFDYFADNGIGDPAITAVVTDTSVGPGNTGSFYFVYDNLPLNVGTTYQIVVNHAAGATNLTGSVSVNGQIYTTLPAAFKGPVTDFRVDTVSISSYGGGLPRPSAQGIVDNLVVTLPPPPIQNLVGSLSNGLWHATFSGQAAWQYTLQRTTNFVSWPNVASTNLNAASSPTLIDPTPPFAGAFYRVQAARP